MRKTTIQAIINITVLTLFVLFLIIYSRFVDSNLSFTFIWFSSFLICCTIICFSKFLLYRRQNFLYFSLVFCLDVLIMFLNKNSFEVLIKNNFGIFIIILGNVSALLYLKYKEKYQLKMGLFFSIVGIVLLLLFGRF